MKISKIVNDNIYNSAWNVAINYNFAKCIKILIDDEIIAFDELLNSNNDIEIRVYDLVKDRVEARMKNKRHLLLKSNSYNGEYYEKITEIKMRERYVNPPIFGQENIHLVVSQIKKYSVDLVFEIVCD
jgi:hypothetical protein